MKLLPLPKNLDGALDFFSNCDILKCQKDKMIYLYKQVLNCYVIIVMNT
jgi:hypothetical protein